MTSADHALTTGRHRAAESDDERAQAESFFAANSAPYATANETDHRADGRHESSDTASTGY